MDRLLCGDVGYGKTEVALRAAFKAVNDGKQVAILAPTTILAQQHYSMLDRMAGYPIRLRCCRFRTPGTVWYCRDWRGGLLTWLWDSPPAPGRRAFKDLGLLIIDEEQRFGVAHKEQLKMLRKGVDALTLSATPIPRTLHMSLVGIRDTSILETPPEDRYPVQTFVLEEDPVLIKEAIRREMSRSGQVFFVYNRVADLDRVAAWVHALVPEARIVIHGPDERRRIGTGMIDFMNRIRRWSVPRSLKQA